MPIWKLHSFFVNYKDAIIQNDLEKTSNFYHYPCIILIADSPGMAFLEKKDLPRPEAFHPLLSFSQKVRQAEVNVLFQRSYSSENVITTVTFDLYGSNKQRIKEVVGFYHLLKADGCPYKILTAHYT